MNQSYKVDHNTLKVNKTTVNVNQLVVGSISTAGDILKTLTVRCSALLMCFFFITKVIKSYKVFKTVHLTVGKLEKSSLIHLISRFGTETTSKFHARLRV